MEKQPSVAFEPGAPISPTPSATLQKLYRGLVVSRKLAPSPSSSVWGYGFTLGGEECQRFSSPHAAEAPVPADVTNLEDSISLLHPVLPRWKLRAWHR